MIQYKKVPNLYVLFSATPINVPLCTKKYVWFMYDSRLGHFGAAVFYVVHKQITDKGVA